MSPYIFPGTIKITESQIINLVCELEELKPEDLKTESKKRRFVVPRQVSMYFIRRNSNYSLQYIGWLFNRDHATVINAIKTVETVRDKKLNELTKKVAEEIQKIS